MTTKPNDQTPIVEGPEPSEIIIIEYFPATGRIQVKAPPNHITALGMIGKAVQILQAMWTADAQPTKSGIVIPRGPVRLS